MKLAAFVATGLLAVVKVVSKTNCNDCGYVEVCYKSGCADYNAYIHAWTDSYTSCNSGKQCAPCFTECVIQDDYVPPTAKDGCSKAGICFGDSACANYNATGHNEWTDEYENCNGVKECAPYYPECVIPGVDYTPAYQRLSCTSESEFRSDAIVDVESGITCRDAGLMFEIDALDCANAEQRDTVRARQLGCCGGADYTELFCPVSSVPSNSNDSENYDNNAALIGGIAGVVGGVLVLAILGIVYMKRFRSNKEYDTSTAMQKSPTTKISYDNDGEESVVSNL